MNQKGHAMDYVHIILNIEKTAASTSVTKSVANCTSVFSWIGSAIGKPVSQSINIACEPPIGFEAG